MTREIKTPEWNDEDLEIVKKYDKKVKAGKMKYVSVPVWTDKEKAERIFLKGMTPEELITQVKSGEIKSTPYKTQAEYIKGMAP